MALRALQVATRLEPGCLECTVRTVEAEDEFSKQVHYEEQWTSEEAIEKRVRSDAFTKLLELLEVAPEPPDVQFDFVERRRGLDYVEAVRAARGA